MTTHEQDKEHVQNLLATARRLAEKIQREDEAAEAAFRASHPVDADIVRFSAQFPWQRPIPHSAASLERDAAVRAHMVEHPELTYAQAFAALCAGWDFR